MHKAEATRRRRAKRAAVKAKLPVLVLCSDGPARGRLVLENTVTGVLTCRLGAGRLGAGTNITLRADQEGRDWVRGWHGKIPDAFRAMQLLTQDSGPTP